MDNTYYHAIRFGESRNMGTRLVTRVIENIRAPFPFVFSWCTDFQEDDPKIIDSAAKRTITEKTSTKAVYLTEEMKEGRNIMTNSVVTMSPPDHWHVDAVGDEKDTSGNYHLFPEGTGTRLEITFDTTYKRGQAPTPEARKRDILQNWDKFVAALELEYKANS